MSNINPILSIGDHLIARRIGYTHHGLYLGDGNVLEYLLHDGVTIVSLEAFAFGREIYIREHTHARYVGAQAVNRGMMRLGENHYNLLTRNCEHFVNWCIDGVESSRQVDNLILTIIPFYSIFQKSDFLKGCLKIVFDDPNSLDEALARINASEKRAIDPIERAKELSEDMFGLNKQNIVNIASLFTTASQLSKEYTQWARQKRHGSNSLLQSSLEQSRQAIDHIRNKLGVSFYTNEHNRDPININAHNKFHSIKTSLQVIKRINEFINLSKNDEDNYSPKNTSLSFPYQSARQIVDEIINELRAQDSVKQVANNLSFSGINAFKKLQSRLDHVLSSEQFTNASEYFQRSLDNSEHNCSNKVNVNNKDSFKDLVSKSVLPPSWESKLPKIHISLEPEVFANAMSSLSKITLESALARHAHSAQSAQIIKNNHQQNNNQQNHYSINDIAIELISEVKKEIKKEIKNHNSSNKNSRT